MVWNSSADLDLEVRDPFGNSIYWDNSTAENAVFDRNINANCVEPTADSPTEEINWAPGASPVGSYEVIVYYVQGCENNNPANLTLNVVVDGAALAPVAGVLTPGQEFLASFSVPASGPAQAGPNGINPGETLANVSTFLTGQTPVATDTSVTGTIQVADPFRVYSFTGATGDIVTIRMDATSGNLDPKLFLLDSSGNLVAVNDDKATGNTNAEIANQTLVSTGCIPSSPRIRAGTGRHPGGLHPDPVRREPGCTASRPVLISRRAAGKCPCCGTPTPTFSSWCAILLARPCMTTCRVATAAGCWSETAM